jgi:hypothetical protein
MVGRQRPATERRSHRNSPMIPAAKTASARSILSKYARKNALPSIKNWVGAGSAAPNSPKISPNTGTTFSMRKLMMQNAVTARMTG